MAEKTLLITAFGPFGEHASNPSSLAMEALPDAIGAYRLQRMLLPVEYGRAAAELTAALEELRPDAVICLGLAAGRKAVTPEFVAVNARDASIPDNAGRLCRGEPCDPAGPPAYGTRLPVRAMVDALLARDIPAAVSYTAGAYVCNDVFYALLRCLDLQDRQIPAGFIHVPNADPSADPAPDRLPLARLTEALIICTEVLP